MRAVPLPLTPHLRADPTMTRMDRVCVGIAMQGDSFATRDIARIVSLRWGAIVQMRPALGLPPLPGGGRKNDRWNRRSGRSLELISRSVAAARMEELPSLCAKLRIGIISGYGIRRAIDYSLAIEVKPDVPKMFRCIECDHLTPTHPCAHCGTSWLDESGA